LQQVRHRFQQVLCVSTRQAKRTPDKILDVGGKLDKKYNEKVLYFLFGNTKTFSFEKKKDLL